MTHFRFNGAPEPTAQPKPEQRLDVGAQVAMQSFSAYIPTRAGVTVNQSSALTASGIYAAVRVLAESVAALPLVVYRQTGEGKTKAKDHALYSILHDQPNRELTSFEWRELCMANLLLWGNSYNEIETNKRGEVIGLWWLDPSRMQIGRLTETRELYYHYQLPNGTYVDLLAEQVMHVRGLSPDGVIGYSPIELARQSIGLSLAAEGFGASFFGNGARPGVVLEHPGKLSKQAHSQLRDSWNETHQGIGNANRLAILEEGMKLNQYSVPPQDAQFLETRQFQIEDAARLYRVPPHMIGSMEKATFSNIEHQALEFVVHSLRPWLVRWEQAIRRDLIGKIERNFISAEFLVDGLLRGDLPSRYSSYAIARQWGWLSVNDIRALENMNPVEKGDIYLQPMNMIDPTKPPPEPVPGANPPTGQTQKDPAQKDNVKPTRELEPYQTRMLESVVYEMAQRVEKRWAQDAAKRTIERDAPDMVAYATKVFAPVATTFGADPELVARGYLSGWELIEPPTWWPIDVRRPMPQPVRQDPAVVNVNVPATVVNVAPSVMPAPVVNVSPAVVVNAPDVVVHPPTVNVNTPRIAAQVQTVSRNAKGDIEQTETVVHYEG